MYKKIILIVIVFFVLCTGSIWFLEPDKKEEEPMPEVHVVEYTIPRQVQYSYTLQNKTGKVIKNAEFWTYAPVKQTAFQRCDTIEASHPYELTTDNLGNQVLYFLFDIIPPYGTKIVTIKADLMLSERPNRLAEKDLEIFLRPEKYIEVDHPDIRKVADTLKASTPLATARKSFQWVTGSMKYSGYTGNDRGALYALHQKKGDCTEFMYLFAALCRANKIPSKCIGGYICPSNTNLKPTGYHNWAEIYEGGAWKSVDPQNKVFMENSSHYISMRIIGNTEGNPMGEYHRFRFKGNGLKVKMNS